MGADLGLLPLVIEPGTIAVSFGDNTDEDTVYNVFGHLEREGYYIAVTTRSGDVFEGYCQSWGSMIELLTEDWDTITVPLETVLKVHIF